MEKLISSGLGKANNQKVPFISKLSRKSIPIYPNISQDYISKTALQHQPNWLYMLQEVLLKTDCNIPQLALKLDLSTSAVRKLLTGNIKNPSYKTFCKILGFYCVVFYLLNTKEVSHARYYTSH